MSFKKKIDNILNTNTLGIDSIYALEKAIGASVGSINKHYKKDKYPGLGIIKKIKTKFPAAYVKDEYLQEVEEPKISYASENETITQELWQQLKQNNQKFQEEIDRLWSLVDRLTLPGSAR